MAAMENCNTMSDEARLITSDEFVTALLCGMAINGQNRFKLSETVEDEKFALAFSRLVDEQESLNVAVDFSIVANQYHGDSSTLREAIYSLRERNVVSINNPSFKTIEIQWDSNLAEKYLSRSPLTKDFITKLVDNYFGEHA